MGRKRRTGKGAQSDAKGVAKTERTAPSSAAGKAHGRSFLRDNADYAAALAAVAVMVLPLFLTDRYFLGSGTDIVSREHPLHAFATSWIAKGILPLWNPFIFGGVPFQAGVEGYLYPLSLTGVFLPLGFDIKLGVFLHLAIAAAGAIYFARARVERRAASALAGMTYALSAFSVSHLFAGHRVLVASFAYVPWIVGAFDRARNGRRSALLPGIAASALMLLAGHYQIVFIGMGGMLVFALLEEIMGSQPSAGITARARAAGAGRAVLFWSVLLAGGAAIAAVQLFPVWATMGLSQRTGGSAEFAASYSASPPHLLTFLLPNLFGNKVNVPFVGDWAYWESIGYLGLAPLALVVFGLVVLPIRRWLPAAIVMALASALALGAHTPLFDVYLSVVPASDLFRSPGRFTLLNTLLGALLAAMALDAWLKGGMARRPGWLIAAAAFLLPAMALAATIALGPADGPHLAAWIAPVSDRAALADLGATRLGVLLALGKTDCVKALVITTAVGFGLVLGLRRRIWTGRIGTGLVVLLAIDLLQFGGRFFTTGARERFVLPPEVLEAIQPELGPGDRIIPPAELRWINFPAMHAIGNAGGYDIFVDDRYARYLNRSQGRKLDHFFGFERLLRGSPLLRLLGPKFLLTLSPLENGGNQTIRGYTWFEPYRTVGNLHIFRDPTPVPRALLVHGFEIVSGEEETLRRMASPLFDPRKTALLEEPLPAGASPPAPAPAGATERAEIAVFEPNRVEIRVQAAAPALLVLSDTLQPGWEAAVDGAPARLFFANRVMRAVPVAAGEHRVVMTYLPRSFVAGAAVSVAALAALVAAFVFTRRRRSSDFTKPGNP